MSKLIITLLAFVATLQNGVLAQTPGICTTMFNKLTCRTTSQNYNALDKAVINGARTWLCNSYNEFCTDIQAGKTYGDCNEAEKLSYAMNLYYARFQSQGASACNFGGAAKLYSFTTTSDTNLCTTMYTSASCRTSSQTTPESTIAGARSWLCKAYPNYCLDIVDKGAYVSCSPAEQLTWAMSQYYNFYKTQGESACNFGGVASVNKNSGNFAVVNPTPAPASVDCTAMFNNLTCRANSQNPATVSGDLAGSKKWLCSNYPQFCTVAETTYASCNDAERASYAFNQYYSAYAGQGASACNFGGVAKLTVTSSNNNNNNNLVVNPTPVASNSKKAGLAWPIDQFHDGRAEPPLNLWSQGAIGWIYTWDWTYPTTIPVASSGLEWVPMLHNQQDVDAFIGRIYSGAYDNSANVLLFNEPDLNYPPYAYGLDVNAAVAYSIRIFQAFKSRPRMPRVGTPVMSYNMGWLSDYLGKMSQQCNDCKFSFVPVHCYTLDANAFQGTVQNYRNTFNLPIWVTEWAQTDFNGRNWQVSENDVKNFMAQTTGFLNSQSWVERYSWFGTMRAVDVQDKANMVMNWDGSRTALGDQYVLRGGAN